MLALLGSLIGLLGSFAPRLMGFFEQKQNHAQEIEMLQVQGQFQLQLLERGAAAKLAEIGAAADSAANAAMYASAFRPTGSRFIDGFNGFVRPFLTLCFFGLYAAVKVAQFTLLQMNGDGAPSVILSMWGEEDWAIWAAIVTFWFGNRTFNKAK